ncbi:MAG TPA: hypothetical protein VKE53_11340 [Pseudolabrys sp.]|jgi:hypothetical protein|nr:hypothetical protein [Pseudolabrys sp.]
MKSKPKKIDPKLALRKQGHKIKFIARKFRIAIETVRLMADKVGRSPERLYAELRKVSARQRKKNRAKKKKRT